MKRKTFFSFHFANDSWRASQVRNIGALEGNEPVSDNDWEGRSCTVVLIGAETANRKWIKYEIKKSWELEKGIVGIKIHNLKDQNGNQSVEGKNPFEQFSIGGINMSKIVKVYNPPYSVSTNVYDYIKNNIAGWVEEAIKIREEN